MSPCVLSSSLGNESTSIFKVGVPLDKSCPPQVAWEAGRSLIHLGFDLCHPAKSCQGVFFIFPLFLRRTYRNPCGRKECCLLIPPVLCWGSVLRDCLISSSLLIISYQAISDWPPDCSLQARCLHLSRIGEKKCWSFVNSKGMMANSSTENYWRIHF